MTQAINKEQLMLNEFKKLSANQQQEVIDFMQFLQYKAQNNAEEKRPISAYEAAQKWAGCVDSKLGDLSTNKAYLEGFGKE